MAILQSDVSELCLAYGASELFSQITSDTLADSFDFWRDFTRSPRCVNTSARPARAKAEPPLFRLILILPLILILLRFAFDPAFAFD